MTAPGERTLFDRVGVALAARCFRLMNALRWQGVENVPPTGPAILAANHQSFLDPVLMGIAVNRRVVFLGWEHYYRWPVLGALMRMYDTIPVDPDKPTPEAMARMLRALREGRLCGIFPEAGRTPDGLIAKPMQGVAVLALRSGAPLIPVTIMGAYRAWPKGRPLPAPAPISLHFGPPVPVEGIRREHAGSARQLRAKVTRELMLRVADGFESLGRAALARASRRRLLSFFEP
jgi:1-acyl-sn-glycerol-3-phosphate acyltransferase